MQLLTAPVYFKLKETEKGTVLVNDGVWKKETISEKFGNRQHFFEDSDGKLKCISGGSANFIIDTHGLDRGQRVKITYDGTAEIANGKYAGTQAHQFKFGLIEDATAEENVEAAPKEEIKTSEIVTDKILDLDDLA